MTFAIYVENSNDARDMIPWAVGIETRLVRRQDGVPIRMWPRYRFVGCVVLSIVLVVLLGALPD